MAVTTSEILPNAALTELAPDSTILGIGVVDPEEMAMLRWVLIQFVIGTLMFNHCEASEESTDESVIERTYIAWVKTTNARDIDSWSSYLAPEAVFVPPMVPPLKTREAILEYYREAFADPNFALDCQQKSVDVAHSGELAWAHGYCHASYTGSSGQKEQGTSRWFKVWNKQPDGSWKCSVNTWYYPDT